MHILVFLVLPFLQLYLYPSIIGVDVSYEPRVGYSSPLQVRVYEVIEETWRYRDYFIASHRKDRVACKSIAVLPVHGE